VTITAPDPPALAPLIALVGCDGSGKSTLAHDLAEELARERPVARCYLGLRSGDLGERIKRLPLIGPAVERKLAAKAGQTRAKDRTIPGLPTAIVVYGFSLLRRRRFRRMLALRRQGIVILTDRYPQAEIPGFYDGPGLSAARAGSRAVALLAAREAAMYRWMAGFHPDLVIRIAIGLDTAAARKPDHRRDLLAEKIAVTPLLTFDGARIVDVDGEQPYPIVRAEVLTLIRGVLAAPL
jgi:hypothetical protein